MEPVYLEVKTITTLVNKSQELMEDDQAALEAMAPMRAMLAERMARSIDFSIMAMMLPHPSEPLRRDPGPMVWLRDQIN